MLRRRGFADPVFSHKPSAVRSKSPLVAALLATRLRDKQIEVRGPDPIQLNFKIDGRGRCKTGQEALTKFGIPISITLSHDLLNCRFCLRMVSLKVFAPDVSQNTASKEDA
jgi:hypothetical protein